MSTTTIRVQRETQQRVSVAARRAKLSADAVIAAALTVYERELFWSAWDRAHAETASPGDDDVFDRASDQDYRQSEADEANGILRS